MSSESAAKMPPLWVIKTRAPFFTATLVPILLSAALVWARTGQINIWLLALTLVGAVSLHAGANMSNDYFDHLWGSDEVNTEFANPFTGGSRLIQMGLVEPRRILVEAIIFLTVGSVIGLFLALTRSLAILWIGLIGVFSAYFYTAPPIRLARTGIGELAIGLCFGPLMALGTYAVQTRTLAWEPVTASLPVMLLIALVIWINQFQDMRADAAVGKDHLVVRLGRQRSATVYGLLLALVYLTIIGGILFAGVTPFALLGLLTVPLAWRAYRITRTHYDHPKELVPANAATIRTHLLTGLLLTLAYILQGLAGLVLG